MSQIFTFTECPIYCRNLLLFVTSARITFSNKIEPRYLINKVIAQGVAAQDGMSVTIDLDFAPLYHDPLFELVKNKQAVEIEFGGMKFYDGRINSFSLRGNHGSIIQGSASMTFYDQYQENFNPIQLQRTIYHQINNQDFQIAHATMTELSHNLAIDVPMSFSYTYNSRFSPIYKVGSEKCQGITMDRQSAQMSLVGENIDKYVSTFGNNAEISFKLRDICGDYLNKRRTKFQDEIWDTQEDTTYSCNGTITNFNSSLSDNGIIKGEIQITQYL